MAVEGYRELPPTHWGGTQGTETLLTFDPGPWKPTMGCKPSKNGGGVPHSHAYDASSPYHNKPLTSTSQQAYQKKQAKLRSSARRPIDLDEDDLPGRPKSAVPQLQQPAVKKQQAGSHALQPEQKQQTAPANLTSEQNQKEFLYKSLIKAQSYPKQVQALPSDLFEAITPANASYQNPTTRSTPLHVAVRWLDAPLPAQEGLEDFVERLIEACPQAVRTPDASGHVPLHYAVAPCSSFYDALPPLAWRTRASVVAMLVEADTTSPDDDDVTGPYLHRNGLLFESKDATGGCSALYRALQSLPDDFAGPSATVEYMQVLVEAMVETGHSMVGVGNASDGDKPLALLYRRFTRQFDLAEKFFPGDNSRPEVVEYRRKYKTAASHTWKIIELLLRETPTTATPFLMVHRAVQSETPPDLLRYIVETHAEDLTLAESDTGYLPLHCAALSKPLDTQDHKVSFPAFYSKYVMDELLYKFPEGAAVQDASGQYPLTLAVRSGKQWIGGGIKSLYDAFPEALKQIDLEEHPRLQRVLSLEIQLEEDDAKEEKVYDDIIRDEPHDAIMLVQQPNVDVCEVVTSMWAHEEDAGVQMLGCVAISRTLSRSTGDDGEVLRIGLSAVAAVVNAMKAHPNEVVVQEKACRALKEMASCDGKREISFVASGAVAAIVGAMQAHVSDPGVQEEACGAVARIIQYGGADRATIVASVSGLTAIVNALAAHPDVLGVQRNGCAALLQLTDHPNANLPELPRSHTEPLLEAARSNFKEACGEAVAIILSRLS